MSCGDPNCMCGLLEATDPENIGLPELARLTQELARFVIDARARQQEIESVIGILIGQIPSCSEFTTPEEAAAFIAEQLAQQNTGEAPEDDTEEKPN